jgi:hypothetical protein
MDTFGRAVSIFLLAGSIVLPLIGCAKNSDGQFQTYDHLKKSPVQDAKPAEDPKIADSASPSTATPASPKILASERPTPAAAGKKSDAPKVATSESAPATKAPAVASVSSPTGTKVTDAAFRASIASRGSRSGAVPVSATAAPRKIELLVPERKFKTEGPEGAWRVSYDDLDLLKELNMDPVPADAATKMPAWLKGLEGKRVRIRGFMYPTFSQTGIHAFGLARDNQICCFGRNPKIYDVFDVQLRDGVTTDYLPNRPFDVVGVFHIRPEAEEGKLFRLYEMDDATVFAK